MRTVRDPATGEEHDRGDLRSCVLCDDTGFVEVDSAGAGTVKPCHRCRPSTHARWQSGEYLPQIGTPR